MILNWLNFDILIYILTSSHRKTSLHEPTSSSWTLHSAPLVTGRLHWDSEANGKESMSD